MSEKCRMSFLGYLAFSGLYLATAKLLLLISINKWLGISIAAALLIGAIAAEVLAFKGRPLYWLASLLNGLACAFALSALFEHLAYKPPFYTFVLVFAGLIAALHCMPHSQKHAF